MVMRRGTNHCPRAALSPLNRGEALMHRVPKPFILALALLALLAAAVAGPGTVAAQDATDYDSDDDNLIEIRTWRS